MHLDLAVAPHKAAEAAFFATDDDAPDAIPRIRLEGLTEFELAHLAIVLVQQFEPRLALDGDCPEDIVSEADPLFVRALAAQPPDALPPLAAQWEQALQATGDAIPDRSRLETALVALTELSVLATQRRHALLYTQQLENYPLAPELD